MDAKSKKVLELFKQLEAEGIKIIPISNNGTTVTSLKDDIPKGKNLEERLKQLGPNSTAQDFWVEAGWKMSF